jgi:hypothetical protein
VPRRENYPRREPGHRGPPPEGVRHAVAVLGRGLGVLPEVWDLVPDDPRIRKFREHGVSGGLAQYVVEPYRIEDWPFRPEASTVAGWIEKHPELAALEWHEVEAGDVVDL